jgi:hypothetical protein
MVEWLLNNELERIWKETTVASEVLPLCLPGEAWDRYEKPVVIGGVPAEP